MVLPLVTAIITTHNRNDFVGRAVESVLNQTYENIECIVVDDASEVSAEFVCKKYPVSFIYIPKEESKGGNHARNIGIMHAKGKYVAFLDDDDYWLPSKIEKQVALIEEKKCALVYSNAKPEFVHADGSISYIEYPMDYLKMGDMSRKIFMSICCLNITILANKDKLFEVGLFDENIRFWQEYELTMRLAQVTPFYFVDEVLAVYRVDKNDKGRLTNKYNEWLQSVEYIYKKHHDKYSQLNLFEKYCVLMNFVLDAQSRAFNSGRKSLSSCYKILLNTVFVPARLLLKYRRIKALKLYNKCR